MRYRGCPTSQSMARSRQQRAMTPHLSPKTAQEFPGLPSSLPSSQGAPASRVTSACAIDGNRMDAIGKMRRGNCSATWAKRGALRGSVPARA
jgi:hypothetical protein